MPPLRPISSNSIKAAAIILLFYSVRLCGADPSPSPTSIPLGADTRAEIVLLSWKAGDAWVFALLPRKQYDELSERIFEPITPKLSAVHTILTISELESLIARTPRTSAIVWRDYPPERIRVGYPPRDIVGRVQGFAAAHGVDLQVIPTIYDP
jgi:hypothetical protein